MPCTNCQPNPRLAQAFEVFAEAGIPVQEQQQPNQEISLLSYQKLTALKAKCALFPYHCKLDPNLFLSSVMSMFSGPQISQGKTNGFSITALTEAYNLAAKKRNKPQLSVDDLRYHLKKPELTWFFKELFEYLVTRSFELIHVDEDVARAIEAVSLAIGVPLVDIFLQDGCYKMIDEDLCDEYKASRHNTADVDAAELGIQSEYSLLHRCFTHLEITGGTAYEASYLQFHRNCIHIADAAFGGYFNLFLAQHAGAYFITKAKTNIAGEIEDARLGGELIPCDNREGLDVKQKVRNQAKYRPGKILELSAKVRVNQKYLQDIPEEERVETMTVRVVRFYDQDGKAGWLLTNLPYDVPAEAILALYRTRWQIELAFQDLKSYNNFRAAKTNSESLTLTFVWASLAMAQAKRIVIGLAEQSSEDEAKLSVKACNEVSSVDMDSAGWCKQLVLILFHVVANGSQLLNDITGELRDLHFTRAKAPSTKNESRMFKYNLQIVVDSCNSKACSSKACSRLCAD